MLRWNPLTALSAVANQSGSMNAASRLDAGIGDFATKVRPLLTIRCFLRVFSGLLPWYESPTTPKLSQELVDARKAAGTGVLEVVDPNDNGVYFIVDGDTHRQAMDALRRQRERDAIAKGITQMEAGEGISIEDARKQTRERLLSRVR